MASDQKNAALLRTLAASDTKHGAVLRQLEASDDKSRALLKRLQRRQGLTDNTCHVILHIVDPRFLREMESHDVASLVCQAISGGGRRCRSSSRCPPGSTLQARPLCSRWGGAGRPWVDRAWFRCLKLKYDELLSNVAFNLRRYIEVDSSDTILDVKAGRSLRTSTRSEIRARLFAHSVPVYPYTLATSSFLAGGELRTSTRTLIGK